MKTLLLGGALSPSSICSLFSFMQLLQYCCTGRIDVVPVTQHANLSASGYATFYCRATTSRNTKWNINGIIMDSGDYNSNGLGFNETIVGVLEYRDVVHDMYLSVPATEERNETMIQCVVVEDQSQFSMPPAILIVQGGLAAPVLSLTVINSTLLLLHWQTPFTWPYTTITHYSISVNNSLENWNRTRYADVLVLISSSDRLLECAVYSFSVVANNGLADGTAGTVTGGFPIAPQLQVDSIEGSIFFTRQLQPIIELTIKLPMVCAYQQIYYLVSLMGPGSELLLQDGPHSQLYGEGAIVSHRYQMGSMNVNSIYASVRFGLQENFDDSATITAYKNFTIAQPDTAILETTAAAKDLDVVLIATLSCSGVLLTASALIMILAAACIYRRRGHFGARRRKTISRAMVTNPIYEGQSEYETIPPALTSGFSATLPPVSSRPPRTMQGNLSYTSRANTVIASPNSTYTREETYIVMASASERIADDEYDTDSLQ